jgi:hypothetical protein
MPPSASHSFTPILKTPLVSATTPILFDKSTK